MKGGIWLSSLDELSFIERINRETMAEYLSPGVYVEEFDSGGQTLSGVSTSTAGFLGLAQKGPIEGLPQLITSFADFQRTFGGYLSESDFADYRYLAYAVEHYFVNGGSKCYVMRVAPSDTKCATHQDTKALSFTAKNPGSWGNKVRITITPASKAKTPILKLSEQADGTVQYRVKSSSGFQVGDVIVFDDGTNRQVRKIEESQDNLIKLNSALEDGENVVDTELIPTKLLFSSEFTVEVSYGSEVEVYENVSLNVSAANHIEKVIARSNLIKVTQNKNGESAEGDVITPFEMIVGADFKDDAIQLFLKNGSDGSIDGLSPANYLGEDRGPGKRTGIQAFIDNDEVSIMAVPGVTEPSVSLGLIAHCENLKSRFAILDFPRDKKKVADLQTYRNMFDTQYAAIYNPWLQVFDPLEKRNIFIPPSGSIAGIYARSDTSRGVYKAPANEVVRACIGLDCQYNKGEQDILNPIGINLIRSFTGQGIRVWGARTLSSNSLWKYVNVRRLFIFLEESIKNGTSWVVFEPNDEQLWARVQRTIDSFLTRVWRDGALVGSSPGEAFYINIGATTMTQDDIDNGRLICEIGVAPVKPAEFVIFRITQKTSES